VQLESVLSAKREEKETVSSRPAMSTLGANNNPSLLQLKTLNATEEFSVFKFAFSERQVGVQPASGKGRPRSNKRVV
jgi:hypothetical protein